jgi:hypothetical protein
VSASSSGTSPDVTTTTPRKSSGSAAGAELLVLNRHVDRAPEGSGHFGDGLLDARAIMA